MHNLDLKNCFPFNFFKERQIVNLTGERAMVAYSNLEIAEKNISDFELDIKNLLKFENAHDARVFKQYIARYMTDLGEMVIPYGSNS